MEGSIASAVVLPEAQDDEPMQPAPASPTGLKRRQSSISEADSKRQRLNSIDANATRRGSTTADDAPAPVTGRRERGRERRLFGAALGALSQNSTTAAQRRRTEIEKRQQAQRRLEEQESDQRKLERDLKRRAQREKQQEVFDRQSMRIRHDNLLNMAHFLRTQTEPHLYYKPWETTSEDNERIQDQVADARDQIRRELEEYEAREQHNKVERDPSRHRSDPNAGAFSSGKELDAATPPQPSTANGGTNDSNPFPKDPDSKEDHAESKAEEAVSGKQASSRAQSEDATSHEIPAEDSNRDVMDVDNGEEVVEAAEDTVIY